MRSYIMDWESVVNATADRATKPSNVAARSHKIQVFSFMCAISGNVKK